MVTQEKGARTAHAVKKCLLGASLLSVALLGTGVTAARADASPAGSQSHTCSVRSAAPASGTSNVIITGASSVDPSKVVGCLSGVVHSALASINGVEADVPNAALPALESVPGITVTPDVAVSVQSTVESTGPHTPSDAFLQETGAAGLTSAGDSGQGVTVAVLDTGISNLPDFAGRLLGGVDFTSDHNPFQDDYGHGTFVAGLVAGNGASSNGQHAGEAPGANLVSIKVAGASGQTDLSTVIQGVIWAIMHRQQYGIRVLNMSLGFQPFTSTVTNPLDQVVNAAWSSGIAVVTSAGNAGPFNGTILSPGDDPLAITAGALDDMATPSITDDQMNDFSSSGPTNPDGWEKPDLVTSGRSVVSLADPGSTVWNQNPSARIGSANFVGSGTSFSAAITSGAAALVLAANPTITPNQLKARLLATTNPGPVGDPFVDGHGALNAAAAAAAGPINFAQTVLGVMPTPMGATVSLVPGQADTWNPALWSGAAWNGAAWNGAAWNGAAWNGSEWNGAAWNGAAWNGAAWNGAAWNGAAWNGAAWNGAAWNGAAWNGAAWNGAAWNGAAWN
jgi:serine protease AprX